VFILAIAQPVPRADDRLCGYGKYFQSLTKAQHVLILEKSLQFFFVCPNSHQKYASPTQVASCVGNSLTSS